MTRRAVCAVCGGILMAGASLLLALAAGAESVLGTIGALALGAVGVYLLAASFD